MKILGIDTTTKFLSIGLSDGPKVYEYNVEVGRNLSSVITVTVKRIIDALGWKIRDIDYFACGIGPGSFTGVRVGVSTIKGMSWSLGKPVISIPTLDILAANVQKNDRYIIPIIDAKRDLVYISVYQNKNGSLKRIKPYMLLGNSVFLKELKNKSAVLGDALNLHKDKILKDTKDIEILDTEYWYPKGRNVIKLAVEKIRLKKFSNAFDVEPIYLYPKECQIRNVSCKNQK